MVQGPWTHTQANQRDRKTCHRTMEQVLCVRHSRNWTRTRTGDQGEVLYSFTWLNSLTLVPFRRVRDMLLLWQLGIVLLRTTFLLTLRSHWFLRQPLRKLVDMFPTGIQQALPVYVFHGWGLISVLHLVRLIARPYIQYTNYLGIFISHICWCWKSFLEGSSSGELHAA